MGLFDNLAFNPSTYGGQGGGLLDMLKLLQSQPQQDASQSFPAFQSPQGTAPRPAMQGFDGTPDYGQASNIRVGNSVMPVFGTAADDPNLQQQSALPPNAQPTQGQGMPGAMQQPQQPQQADPSPAAFGAGQGGIGTFMQSLAATGMPFQSLMAGISGQRSDPAGMQQQQMRATYQSLVSANVPPNLAMAAALNPEILKTIAPAYFDTAPKLQETGQDPLTGAKSFSAWRPAQGTLTPIGGGSAQGGAAGGGFFAKGISGVDSSLNGDDYLKQFSPEVQEAVKNYVGGKSLPTGNPRPGFTGAIKMIAQKYGNDVGTPADDTTFAARRAMRNQLSSAAPSSLGGQINIGNTAAGHLADLSQKALDLGNYDTGISFLSSAVNGVRGMTTDQAAKINALKGAAQHYGQEITKFYAGSPGGQAERDRFLTEIDGAKSPKELAAVLETEAELMHSRLGSLGDQIKGVLGPMANDYPVVRPDSEKAFAKIQDTVGQLRNGAAPSPQTPAAALAQQQPIAANPTSAPISKTIGGKNYIKHGDQWFEAN